ncbi:hypothetical protein GCM10014719_56600 [Planomonospora parontospora subsp. antibiotica]|nr:hypothetical protein GCM10014719_56600 [Planomonospora parontospora subsp. antibiotica]GII18798.1 hypothetical protein Ppa05_55240 [Planomonospora parontospora subsp. antibiotica]
MTNQDHKKIKIINESNKKITEDHITRSTRQDNTKDQEDRRDQYRKSIHKRENKDQNNSAKVSVTS